MPLLVPDSDGNRIRFRNVLVSQNDTLVGVVYSECCRGTFVERTTRELTLEGTYFLEERDAFHALTHSFSF